MEEIKMREKNNKKIKRKLKIISLLLTLIFIIIIVILSAIFKTRPKVNYETPNSYVFLGNILTTNSIYPDILLTIEEIDSCIYGVTLKNNEMISKKAFCNNIDYSKIKNFGVITSDYNNDKNKDFIYLYDNADEGYIYKFYSVDRKGEISELGIDNITISSNDASLKLKKSGNSYIYEPPIFYYDNYKIKAQVGEYKLSEKVNINKKTINKNSKIITDEGYNAIPRKIMFLEEVPEYLKNVNNYLLDIEKKECIEVDLDGNGSKEYIVWFMKDGKTYLNLFDNSSNFIVTLLTVEDNKELQDIIEIADVDNDNIMEIILVKEKGLEVHKYNNGFYY